MATQSFTTSGSWTCPTGVTRVTVECWGGGGPGGNASNGATSGKGGGGAGGSYARKLVTVTPGTSYTVTVGAQQSTNATNGNPSWFSTTGTVFAEGGAYGSPAVGGGIGLGGAGSSALNIGDVVYAGGNGGTASTGVLSGAGGGGAGSNGVGGNANISTAGTGTALEGGNGGGGTTAGSNGSPGSVAGGGGSGGCGNSATLRTGGAGARGLVILTWGSLEETTGFFQFFNN